MAQTQHTMRDPTTQYPSMDIPEQRQDEPGLDLKLQPLADHGQDTYVGAGRLEGRKALITGGDSGIGRAVAIAYAREGADVAINYLPSEQPDADEVVAQITAAGRKAVAIAGDISEESFCHELVEQVVAELGGLDILVNLYFGGVGEPNGPGHAHYVMDANGNLTYKREPFDPHGAQNFAENQRDYSDVIAKEAAFGGEFGFRCKFRGYDAYVESNTNRQGREKIDIYYSPNGPFGQGHHHAVAYRESPFDFVSDNLR